MNEICALFHVCEAVSEAVLRRMRMFRTIISRGGAERRRFGMFGRAGAPRTPQKGLTRCEMHDVLFRGGAFPGGRSRGT